MSFTGDLEKFVEAISLQKKYENASSCTEDSSARPRIIQKPRKFQDSSCSDDDSDYVIKSKPEATKTTLKRKSKQLSSSNKGMGIFYKY